MKYKETPFGNIPDYWDVMPISSVTNLVTDYVANGSFASLAENVTYKENEDYAVLIRLVDYNNDFKGNFVFIDEHAYEFLEKSKLYGNEIIISNVGANVGTVFRCPKLKYKMSLAPNSIVVKFKENDDFYFYWLRSHAGQHMLHSIVTGSAQPKFNKTNFRDMLVPVPPRDQQDKIVSILKPLEDKISFNKIINDNLLQQAKTLFKSCFVDFDPFDEPMIEAPTGFQVPSSLKMVQIQDLPHILETGKRPKGGAVSEGIPSVGAENVKELGVFDSSSAKYIPIEFAQTMKKGKIEGYELLLYKDGGKPGTFTPHFSMFGEGFPYEEFYINEHVFKLDFEDRGYNEFAYLYMQTDYPYHWLANNGGKAAIPGINQQNVNEIWIYHPSHPRVQEFCKWVQPIFTTIFTNCAQNMKLTKLRDALLPKLMTGELDVSKLDI